MISEPTTRGRERERERERVNERERERVRNNMHKLVGEKNL